MQASDFVVGSVGRLVKEKGFMELFAAAEALTARCPQIKFLVIGPRETDQDDALDSMLHGRLAAQRSRALRQLV